MRRLGVLMNLSENDPEAQALVAAFVMELQQLGWSDRRNVHIDYRWSAGDIERVRKYAAELVALAPDVILAYAGSAVGPLQQATRTVPIVFAGAIDGPRRLGRELGPARWQYHRLHATRIQRQWEMVESAQRDHAQRESSGCPSESFLAWSQWAIECIAGRGGHIRSGVESPQCA
jgi:hypothetical protein